MQMDEVRQIVQRILNAPMAIFHIVIVSLWIQPTEMGDQRNAEIVNATMLPTNAIVKRTIGRLCPILCDTMVEHSWFAIFLPWQPFFTPN